jgi:hypothetical protein
MQVAVVVLLTASHTAPSVSMAVWAGVVAAAKVAGAQTQRRLPLQGRPTPVVEVVAVLTLLEAQGAQGL